MWSINASLVFFQLNVMCPGDIDSERFERQIDYEDKKDVRLFLFTAYLYLKYIAFTV